MANNDLPGWGSTLGGLAAGLALVAAIHLGTLLVVGVLLVLLTTGPGLAITAVVVTVLAVAIARSN